MKKDFKLFLYYIWKHILFLPPPTRTQYDIANYLSDTSRKKRYIQAFRGVGKSFITAAYVVWRLWKDPNLRIMIVSANEGFASEIALFIKQIIKNVPFLIDLVPRQGQRDSALIFDVGLAKADKSPSVKAVGITGQLTGSRADIILSDDVEVPKNSATETMRDQLKKLTEEYAAIIKKDCEIIYLGTPQTEQTIYSDLPDKGYHVRIWPSRYPLEKNLTHYKQYLSPMLLKDIEEKPELMKPTGSRSGGSPTDPERFDEEDLMSREAEYSRSGFSLQFMLDTRMSDANKYPLKLSDFIMMDVDSEVAPVKVSWASGKQQYIQELPNLGFDGDRYCTPLYVSPEHVPYTGSILTIDPSGRGVDETGYCVTKMLNGMIYVRRWGGLKGGYDKETLTQLANIAKTEKVNLVNIEDNFGDGMYTQLFSPILKNIYPCTIEEFKVHTQKELRIINTLEPVLNQHRLVMDKSIVVADYNPEAHDNRHSGMYQLTHITKDRGSLRADDRVDVLAMSVEYWTTQLNRDVTKADERHRDKLMAAEIKKWHKDTIGYSKKRKTKGYVSIR